MNPTNDAVLFNLMAALALASVFETVKQNQTLLPVEVANEKS